MTADDSASSSSVGLQSRGNAYPDWARSDCAAIEHLKDLQSYTVRMVPITSDQRDFLLKDLQAASAYFASYASGRAPALGGCVALLGAIMTFGNKDGLNLLLPGSLAQLVPMLLVVYATLRVIGTANRSVYVFVQHIARIEYQLGMVGFGSYWIAYVENGGRDGNAHAFISVCRVLNLLVSAYGVFLAAYNVRLSPFTTSTNGLCAGVLLVAMASLVINERQLRYDADPLVFLERIRNNSEKAWGKAQLRLKGDAPAMQ